MSERSMMERVKAATHAYVGYCDCGCGAMVAATVDIPGEQKRTGQQVASFIRQGLTVERVEMARTASLMPCLRKQEKRRATARKANAQGSLTLATPSDSPPSDPRGSE